MRASESRGLQIQCFFSGLISCPCPLIFCLSHLEILLCFYHLQAFALPEPSPRNAIPPPSLLGKHYALEAFPNLYGLPRNYATLCAPLEQTLSSLF